MNFSICLISRNEQRTLPRLLESLSEFRDRGGQIVLVDTGSTDKTVEVAKKYGVEVTEVGNRFQHIISKEQAKEINAWSKEGKIVKAGDKLFDFASARNFAASLSKTDFIFMPDCDEVYTTLAIDELNRLIKEGVEQFEYQFVYSHDEQGRPAIQFLHSKAYDRRKLKWVGIVHEVLSGNAKRLNLPESVIKLEHYQNEETNRDGYLKGLALDVLMNPDNDRNLHYFGRELFWKGKPKTAIEILSRHVDMMRWPAERAQSLYFMGLSWLQLGVIEKAKNSFFWAYQTDPSRRIGLMKLAEMAYQSGDALQTASLVEAMLPIKYTGFYADDKNDYRNIPHEWAYWAYWQLGDRARSKYHWEKAIEFAPEHPKYREDGKFYLPKVSILLPQLGREEGLKRAKKSIENLNYPKDLVELLVDDREEPTVPEKVKDMAEKATGDYLLFASNDIEFDEDCLFEAVRASEKLSKRLIALNTGVEKDNEGKPVCEHFLIKKDLIPELGGEIFDTSMTHVGVDTLLWNKAEKLNEFHWSKEAKAEHFHFTRGHESDWVYERGWKNADKDRSILSKKLKKLSQGVSPSMV